MICNHCDMLTDVLVETFHYILTKWSPGNWSIARASIAMSGLKTYSGAIGVWCIMNMAFAPNV